MYDFYIQYESYMGKNESIIVTADTEADAERIFYAARPLSKVINIEKLD